VNSKRRDYGAQLPKSVMVAASVVAGRPCRMAPLIGDYNADLFVDNRLIIELKAAKALADEHVAQILGYLRSSGVEHGLLINFGAPKFEIKKYVLSRMGEASRPGGLIGGTLSLFASLAPSCGWFHFGR
jgi:PD-(D/E)XK nuclease superfamily